MMNITNSYRRYALTLREINDYARQDPQGFVEMSENAYRSDIKEIARSIVDDKEKCRVILLAGPSASGKTTTAKMLNEEFEKIGCGSEIVSMDNFYLGERSVPKTEDGKPDFETVHALNIPQIEQCISNLLEYGWADIAQFDFASSTPLETTTRINLHNDSIAIIEGIHALNPIFTEHIRSKSGLKKIYISVKQGIRKTPDTGYMLTAAELRLMRRIVRDCKFRGSNAEHTMGMWENVLLGEKKYITPYKYAGDITINSLHIYEPCVIAAKTIPYMSKVEKNNPEYDYAQFLIAQAERFCSIDESLVPEDSLLREFLGNGKYRY